MGGKPSKSRVKSITLEGGKAATRVDPKVAAIVAVQTHVPASPPRAGGVAFTPGRTHRLPSSCQRSSLEQQRVAQRSSAGNHSPPASSTRRTEIPAASRLKLGAVLPTRDEGDHEWSSSEDEDEGEDKPHSEARKPRTSIFLNLPALPPGHEKIKRVPMSTEYARHQIIGRGGFSTVHLVKHIASGKKFAAKIISLNDERKKSKKSSEVDQDTRAMEEAVLQMRLRHPHIVRILDVFHEPGVQGCFIEEYMQGGTVHDWRAEEHRIPEGDASAIFARLVNALTYLHDHDVVHCDIKLENLLLGHRRDPTSVKLADFGLAKVIHESKTTESEDKGEDTPRRRRKSGHIVGTLGFIAPEVVFGLNFTLGGKVSLGGVRSMLKSMRGSFGPEVDVWSAGVCLYIMLGGAMQALWPENSPAAVLNLPPGDKWGCFQRTAVSGLKCILPFPDDRFIDVSKEARAIVSRCMQCAPQGRATAAEMLKEMWCATGLAMTSPERPPSSEEPPSFPELASWEVKDANNGVSHWTGVRALSRPSTTTGCARNHHGLRDVELMPPPTVPPGFGAAGFVNPYRPGTVGRIREEGRYGTHHDSPIHHLAGALAGPAAYRTATAVGGVKRGAAVDGFASRAGLDFGQPTPLGASVPHPDGFFPRMGEDAFPHRPIGAPASETGSGSSSSLSDASVLSAVQDEEQMRRWVDPGADPRTAAAVAVAFPMPHSALQKQLHQLQQQQLAALQMQQQQMVQMHLQRHAREQAVALETSRVEMRQQYRNQIFKQFAELGD